MTVDTCVPSSPRGEEGAPGSEELIVTTYAVVGLHDCAAAEAVLAALDGVQQTLVVDVWLDAGEITVLTERAVGQSDAATALRSAGFRLDSAHSRTLSTVPPRQHRRSGG